VPLGPFGAKNFCTSISPWVVMTDALEAFKCQTSAGAQTEVVPLDYLRDPSYTSYDVALSVEITPPGGSPTVVSRSNYRNQYWTCRQQLVHHAVTGCDMRPGDLLASGTISGTEPGSYGSMLELCWQGTKEVGPLSDGSVRKFIKDGDTVTIRGACTHPSGGYVVGFGEVTGKLLPAKTKPPVEAPAPAPLLRDVKLHSYWRSSCSWRVRTALAFYGIPYSYVGVNLLKGDQVRVSEMAQVPRLDFKDAGGSEVSITQSLAIIELLCDVSDAAGKRSLRPLDPVGRAKARQIAEIFNAGTQPLQNLSHIKEMQGDRPKDVIDGRQIAKAAIVRGLAAAEALVVRADGDARFCVGSQVTIADCCLVPQLYNARRFEVDLSEYPRLMAIEAHLATLPAFREAHPDNQPDAVKQ
jgi:maleylacetoacetate isomerase